MPRRPPSRSQSATVAGDSTSEPASLAKDKAALKTVGKDTTPKESPSRSQSAIVAGDKTSEPASLAKDEAARASLKSVGKDTMPRRPPSRSQSATVAGDNTSEPASLAKDKAALKAVGKDTTPKKPPSRSQSATVAGNKTWDLAELRNQLSKTTAVTSQVDKSTVPHKTAFPPIGPQRGTLKRSASARISAGSIVSAKEKVVTAKASGTPHQQCDSSDSNSDVRPQPTTSAPRRRGVKRSESAHVFARSIVPETQEIDVNSNDGTAPQALDVSSITSKLTGPPPTSAPRRGGLKRSASAGVFSGSTATRHENGDTLNAKPAQQQPDASVSIPNPPPTASRGTLQRSISARIDVGTVLKQPDFCTIKPGPSNPMDEASSASSQTQGERRRGALKRSASARIDVGPSSLLLAKSGPLKGDTKNTSARSNTGKNATSQVDSSRPQPRRRALQRSESAKSVPCSAALSASTLTECPDDKKPYIGASAQREPKRGALKRSASEQLLGIAPANLPASTSGLSKPDSNRANPVSDGGREGKIERRGNRNLARHGDASKTSKADDAPRELRPRRRGGGLSKSTSSRIPY